MNTLTPKFKLLRAAHGLDPDHGGDCDCACAGVSGLAVGGAAHHGQMAGAPNLHYLSMEDQACWLAFNPVKNGGMAVVSMDGRELLESFRHPRKIEPHDDLGVIGDMVGIGLLDLEGGELERLPAEANELGAWLHVTDRCNLRCSYCYLPHVREDMSSETGRGAIDAIFRSAANHEFKRIKLKYAGGEPLLRFPMIAELHRYARKVAETAGVALDGVVLSNGTLLNDETASVIKSLGLRLMISLDGLGNYHDAHRPYAGGKGTFQDVERAIEIACRCGILPHISVTVSSRTVDGLPQVLTWILEHGLPFSLNFYRENELSIPHKDMQLDEEKIIRGMREAFSVLMHNLPRRPFLGGLLDRANLSSAHLHPCGVGQNYLVFDQNGQVAKCQMHIRKPITNINAADPLKLIRMDQIGIQNISVEEKQGCNSCEWRYWCAGGCPLMSGQATGRYDVPSPNCGIYKALFPDALRLEGLRLLKYQNDSGVVFKL